MTTLRRAVLLSLYGAAGIAALLLAPNAMAQSTDPLVVDKVNLAGTRRAARFGL